MNIAISGFGAQFESFIQKLNQEFSVHQEPGNAGLEKYLLNQSLTSLPAIVLVYLEDDKGFNFIENLKKRPLLEGLILALVTNTAGAEMYKRAKELNVDDLFVLPLNELEVIERLQFLVKFKFMKPTVEELSASTHDAGYKLPLGKRLFDIVFAGFFIILASPLLILVALLIRLESRGPIVYRSKRTGTGYNVFDFLKFRSMSVDADKKLAQLTALNQYQSEEESGNKKAAFMKIKNDPRITRVGSFIRNTSIDEIPQLFNILKGDMSVVGNRPLPLYEAEQLTSNEWAMRFAAPAGLTGLWQIKKRGTADMSERERKKLDNFYAEKYSFWFDMKILFGTIPALLQKEKV